LLSWYFLSVSCTFWLAISSTISIKFSLISCRISSFRVFLWASLGSLSWFIFVSLESGSGILFSSFPSGSCTNLLLGENGFHLFSVFPSFHLLLLLSLYCVQFSIV
jgi:hypothetical protein